MVSVSIETITPDIAAGYLKKSKGNRRVRPRSVDALARDLINGKFYTTNQGIGFNENGELIDGHHRLLAILKAKIPATMQVTRNMENGAVFAIDRGENRSVSDVFHIASHQSQQDNKILCDTKMISAINALVSMGCRKVKLSAADTVKVFQCMERPITSAYEHLFSKRSYRNNNASVLAAAIAAISCGVDPDLVVRFMGVFSCDDVIGCDGLNIQAPLNWRRQLDKAKSKHAYVDKRKQFLGTQNAIWHFINNTNISRITVPDTPRYDVRERLMAVIPAT